MNKKFKIILSIILGLVIVGGALYAFNKYYLETRGLTKFADDQWHFSFKYNPEVWQVPGESDKKIKYSDVNFAFIIPRSTNTSFTIKVSRKEGKKELDLNASIDDLNEKLPKRLKEFNKLESKLFRFNNTDAIDYRFRYVYQPMELLQKETGIQREIIFFKNEILYTLMLTAVPGDFEKDNAEFEGILKSFKVE